MVPALFLAINNSVIYLHVRHSGPSDSCLLVLPRSTRAMCLLHFDLHKISVMSIEIHEVSGLHSGIVVVDALFWQLP